MTNEELSNKILNDIQYIKDKAEVFQKRLVDFKLDENQLKEIRSVLNYFRTADFTFISTPNNQEGLLNFENLFSSYKISIETFLDNATQQRLNNFVIHNTKVYAYMGDIINAMKNEFTPVNQENHPEEKSTQDLLKRIEDLEKKPEEIMQALNINLNRSKELIDSAEELSQQSKQTLEGILQYKAETVEQNEKLVTKLENTINQKISTLLSKQLEEKSTKLFREVIIKFILFLFALIILFLFNVSLMEIYLNVTDLPFVPKIYPALSKMDFWHFIALKLSMNIPFFLFIGFTLNDYTKAKKLYEEYEFRKISAITLFTNYERLTKELGMEKEDLMESLKSSLDKIFDNPVHSIYGDKSGDKNIGLDQLEKITSIIEKMKSK
jgi:hypothetical protein